MTDLKMVSKGVCYFFVGFIISLIAYHLLPTILDLFTNTNQEGIGYIGVILIWAIAIIVFPAGITAQGLRQPEEGENTVFGIAAGVVYFIFGILLTIFGWFMIAGLNNMIDETLLKVIFWIGFTLIWVLAVIIAPMMKITHASETR